MARSIVEGTNIYPQIRHINGNYKWKINLNLGGHFMKNKSNTNITLLSPGIGTGSPHKKCCLQQQKMDYIIKWDVWLSQITLVGIS